MEREHRVACTRLIYKEVLYRLKFDPLFRDHFLNELSRDLVAKLMQIIETEGEVVIRQPSLRVIENIPNNSVEYRKEIKWFHLVRCKDCTHRDGKDGQCPVQSTGDPYYDQTPEPDWFCADGERRTDAEIH